MLSFSLPRGVWFCAFFVLLVGPGRAQEVRFVEPDAKTGTSRAAVVPLAPLAHTTQLLPLDRGGKVVGVGKPEAQVERLLELLEECLKLEKSELDRVVKVNVYVARNDVVPVVQAAFAKRFTKARPAVCFVAGKLRHDEALVALDAVGVCGGGPGGSVRLNADPALPESAGAHLAILPAGARVYVSGQAEKGDVPTATRKTLGSLRNTLTFLRLKDSHVVQVKAFLTPITAAAEVEKEITAFFGKGKVPPLVFVEWRSLLPIEIELIAAAGPARDNTPDVIDYLTPTGMTASPVFSRVARINDGPTVYVSGLYGDPAKREKAEVENLFSSLGDLLKKSGSDFKHLAKATYYCSTDGSSKALNELRSNWYDAKRPPSASKALVAGTGIEGRTLTLDMIAVPTLRVPTTPPEHGHGLTAKEAAEGWISLFDGKTTFGWDGAKVEDGVLIGGMTTTEFGPCALRGELTRGGVITIGVRGMRVGDGPLTVDEIGKGGAIRLGQGVAVRKLMVRPLGMKPIFGGKDLDGWKPIHHKTLAEDRRPTWKVEGGKLIAVGGPGAMEYEREKFGDFVLQLDVRTRARHVNGGVFVRSIPGDFMNGYEAQVYNRCLDGDPGKPVKWCTGGIDDRQNCRRLVSRDLETFTMTVIAHGPHLATWVNGHQVTDWTDTRPKHDNPRQGLRTEPGTIQFQAHDPDSDLEFSNIRAVPIGGK